MPKRKQLVHALTETADLLELLGENAFRVRAYRAAASGIEKVHEETPALLACNFADVAGVGKGLAAELVTFCQTGHLPVLDELHAQVPQGVRQLLEVRGLGPKKVKQLWEAGIVSVSQLGAACESGELLSLKGFGPKTLEALKEAVQFVEQAAHLARLDVAYPLAAEFCHRLSQLQARPAGELVYGSDLVSHIMLTVTGSAEQTHAALQEAFPEIAWQPSDDPVPCFVGQCEGLPVSVAYSNAHDRPALELWLGSPSSYQQVLQEAAEHKRQVFSQGRLMGGLLDSGSVQTVEQRLGLTPRAPLHRESEHLQYPPPDPEQLVKVGDIRGLLHTHSTATDGTATWPQMLQETLRLGHEYLGTADHSVSAHYVNGLSIERVRQHIREVRAWQADGWPILAGMEVDILADGSLDYPDDLLSELDYVVASVHSQIQLPQAEQTKRIIRAASHPLVNILGHMTGRILLRRPAMELDIDEVLEACQASHTAVELNANPQRLDLNWRDLLRWHQSGLHVAVNTDAHSVAMLSNLHYGVLMARKAMIPKANIVNTWSKAEFLAWVRQGRES